MQSILFLSDNYFWGMLAWLAAGACSLVILVRRRRRVSSRARRWVHAGLSAWMVLSGLTGVELYYALLYDTTDSFSMTNVSKKWFAMHVKPGERELRFNTRSGILYREDHDLPATRSDEDQRHVVFVGDSFTYGHGVKRTGDRFTNRLAMSLEATRPGRYTITNLSNAGRDLYWVHRLLEELFAGKYPVDRVIYVVCLNDIETFHPRHKTYYTDLARHAPTFFLWRDTYFFNLMYFRLRQFAIPDIRDYYRFVREYYDGQPWQDMQDRLDDVLALCQRHEARLEVIVFPFLHNLGPDYPFRDVHDQFAEWGKDREVRLLDLIKTLQPHVSSGLTVNAYDAHPNERAHALVAETIERALFAD